MLVKQRFMFAIYV